MFKKNIMLLDLRSLQIGNFKCFKKEQTFDFSKLTLITGANSSGKSSILHAILGSIQSDEMPFRFSPNGKYTNMGDFKEISNGHKADNIIKIGLKFYAHGEDTEYNITTTWKRHTDTFLPELNSLLVVSDSISLSIENKNGFQLCFSYNPDKDKTASEKDKNSFYERSLTSFRLGFPKSLEKSKKKLNEKEEMEKFKKYLYTFYKKTTNLRISNIPSLDKIENYVKKKKNVRLGMVMDIVIPNFIHNFDQNFNLISSFRLHPSRTYLETSRDKSKVDKFGEGYLDQIMIWERNDQAKFKELESVLQDLKLLTSLKSNRIEGGRYEVQLTPNENGVRTALPDVGFGISQFLPIIVADLQLPTKSTLMVAEPEIHLHPNVQAKFGDYLVKQIKNKNKRYILETHSEYLLNRIRLAIVKNQIDEKDVSIYYLENDGKDVKTHRLTFTKDGQVKNAPKSFFETYMMDLKDIALSAEL